jgi:hypothetical protein
MIMLTENSRPCGADIIIFSGYWNLTIGMIIPQRADGNTLKSVVQPTLPPKKAWWWSQCRNQGKQGMEIYYRSGDF